jgi:recombination protein RecT
MLTNMKSEIEKALPKHVTADTMLRVVMTEVQLNPKILECTPQSFLKSVMQASQIGVVPDGMTGRAHLVPYKNKKNGTMECKLIVGYRGLLELSRRSKELTGIYARCVYAKDTFSYSYGMEPSLKHIETSEPDPGEITYAYAVAFLKDGGMPIFEVMSKRQLDAIRDRSAYGSSGPWATDPDPMCRKTALRKLCKVLPFSTETQRAVTIDELNERNLPVPSFINFAEPPADDQNGSKNTQPASPGASQTAPEAPSGGKSGSGKLESFSGKVESADGLRKQIRALVAELGYTDIEPVNNLLLDLSARDEGPFKDSAFDMDGLGKAKSVGLMKEVVASLEGMKKQKEMSGGAKAQASGDEPSPSLFDDSGDPGPESSFGGVDGF